MILNLTSEKSLIFRITHIQNLPWILDNGLHCKSSQICDPNFVTIGNTGIIEQRSLRVIQEGHGRTLAD
jgi:ssDNA thymidine ADP-ribosyltransferase, DarT